MLVIALVIILLMATQKLCKLSTVFPVNHKIGILSHSHLTINFYGIY